MSYTVAYYLPKYGKVITSIFNNKEDMFDFIIKESEKVLIIKYNDITIYNSSESNEYDLSALYRVEYSNDKLAFCIGFNRVINFIDTLDDTTCISYIHELKLDDKMIYEILMYNHSFSFLFTSYADYFTEVELLYSKN